MNIAIDGPAGAGKSSIARLAAKKLNYVYVDTGAMFRTMALYFLNENINPAEEETVTANCGQIQIAIEYQDGEQHIFLNGSDVSADIRKEEVGRQASVIARYPAVRTKLLNLQRKLASENDVIMDVRYLGTVVLPDGECKVYLTACAVVRAGRRYKELREKGIDCDLAEIEKDIIARDEQDMKREIAPLTQAEDAVLVDSSNLTIDEVVEKICELAKGASK